MTKRTILIAVLLLVFAGFLWYFSGNGNKYKWSRTLRLEENEPYDLSVFYKTIKAEYHSQFDEITDNESFADNSKDLNPGNSDIYMFVGKNCYLTQNEVATLKDHVFNGGTAFISAERMSESLFDAFPILEKVQIEDMLFDSFVVAFRHPEASPKKFTFLNYYRLKPENGNWFTFHSGNIKSDTVFENRDDDFGNLAVVSSNAVGGADFICLYYGSGKLFLHANPTMFSNVYQTFPYGRQYLAVLLRHLPGNRVVFDRGAGFPKKDAEARGHTNLLEFIKSEASLWYAWQLLLVSVGLFLIFAGRRTQRNIPVIEPPRNHTMGFVDAIGRFYKSERQNALVFQREWAQFLSFLQYQFRIRLRSLQEDELKKLSEKSGVALNTINNLVRIYEKYAQNGELSAAELMETNKAIGRFYEEYRNNYGKSGNTKRTAKPA